MSERQPPAHTGDDLHRFYLEQLQPELRRFEQRRRRALKNALILLPLLYLLSVPLTHWLARINELRPSVPGLLLFAFIPALILAALCGLWMMLRALKGYKKEMIGRLVKFVNPSLDYFPDRGICEQEFKSTRMFHQSVDRYRSEDLICGNLGKTRVKFAELHASEEVGSGKNRRYQTIFKGLMMIADFNKNFKGVTLVLPDQAEKLLGSWLGSLAQKLNWSVPGQLVKLEDPEFEELFVVYGTDQIEARYLLSPALMQRMVALRRQYRGNIYFSFVASRINLAVSSNKDRFEPGMFKPLDDYDVIRAFYRDLIECTSIVDELNLNNRIWTKE